MALYLIHKEKNYKIILQHTLQQRMEERWWRTEFIHGGGKKQKIIFKSQSGDIVQRQLIFVLIYQFHILFILLLNVIFPLFAWIKLLFFFFMSQLRQRLYLISLLLPYFLIIPPKLRSINSFLPIKKTITEFLLPQQLYISHQTEKSFLISCIWYLVGI